MSGEAPSFSSLVASLKVTQKQQKSDDIMTFIVDNWKLFAAKRSTVMEAYDSLGRNLPYTVDAFCDALGIPDYVYFKRVKVADLNKVLRNFAESDLFDVFQKCCDANRSNGGEVCVFIVAGNSSICVTNMQTVFPDGMMICYLKQEGQDIHIFNVSDAQKRLPDVFNTK